MMNENSYQELYKSGKEVIRGRKRKSFIIFSLMTLAIILFYSFVLISFYLVYPKEIIETYLYSPYSYYLTLITIIVIVKIIMITYATFFFFNKWISREEQHYNDMPFLLGLFFYFFIPGKLLDLVIYTIYCNQSAFSNLNYFALSKFRYIMVGINLLPLLILGFYLYLFKINLDKPDKQREIIARRNALIISTIYMGVFIGGLILIPSMILILLFGALGLALISLSFIIWIFITIYKGKIIPEINSLIISIGFITYLIFMTFYPFLIYFLKYIPIHGDGIGGLIMETGSLISFIIIIIGFKTKASY